MSGETATTFAFNGLNGETGEPLTAPLSAAQLVSRAARMRIDALHLADLQARVDDARPDGHLGVRQGIDPTDLAQAGWGVIFPRGADQAVRDALHAVRDGLRELLDHRRSQAGERYHEYWDEEGYQPGESKTTFLLRHGAAAAGAVDPQKVPYYLLLVGEPTQIPYEFQYQLDVQYAVGRVCFDTPEEYARYARSVVRAERDGTTRTRRATFFPVRTPADGATQLSAELLVEPLAAELTPAAQAGGWEIRCVAPEDCTKAHLSDLLGGAETPSLVFTASHGVGFDKGHELQRRDQGALVCRDYPGRKKWGPGPIPPEHYFAAADVPDSADVRGLIAFHFACFGAGTPQVDSFPQSGAVTLGDRAGAAEIAPLSFVARLPQQLLAHPNGGALAVIGHVDRALGFSIGQHGSEREAFRSALASLLEGKPVGMAMEFFNQRYAELASDLVGELPLVEAGAGAYDSGEAANRWTAANDARGLVVLGDPAVRLVAAAGQFGVGARAWRVTAASFVLPDGKRIPYSEYGDTPSGTLSEVDGKLILRAAATRDGQRIGEAEFVCEPAPPDAGSETG